jgi:methyl-accepting chemotaxis protein
VEAAETVSNGARNQSAGIEKVTAAAERLQKATADISVSTEKTADTIARTAQFSESGNAIVKRVIEEILGIHEVVEKMVFALARINDIADQTNLLALNAAIEASRAADGQGGFSVVADEIRTLAEKSSEAAGEVSRWVRQVENVIFSGGESSKEAGKIFDTIRRDLGAFAGFVQELSASASDQLAANREVTGYILAIATVVDRNSAAATTVSRIIADLKAEMAKLDALVGDRELQGLPPATALPGRSSAAEWRQEAGERVSDRGAGAP